MRITLIEQLTGLCLLTLILLDVFVTVLYARAGSGIIAPHAERWLWRFIRWTSAISSRMRDGILSLGGPLVVVAVVAMWFAGLSLGAALVIHPALGTGVRTSSGETPTSFIAALFAGGSSVSIVGSGGFEPSTDTFRLFYWLTSLTGTAVTSLVLTYLMQVYTALLRRNTVALLVDSWSSQTGDAVELLARLFPDNQTSAGYNVMVQWASSMASVKEMHHFYPVLCYFRFTDPRYSMARTALVSLETGVDSYRARPPAVRMGASIRRIGAARTIGTHAARDAGRRKPYAGRRYRKECCTSAMEASLRFRSPAIARSWSASER